MLSPPASPLMTTGFSLHAIFPSLVVKRMAWGSCPSTVSGLGLVSRAELHVVLEGLEVGLLVAELLSHLRGDGGPPAVSGVDQPHRGDWLGALLSLEDYGEQALVRFAGGPGLLGLQPLGAAHLPQNKGGWAGC